MNIEMVHPPHVRDVDAEPLRVQAVAKSLGVHENRVYALIKSGRLDAYRAGPGRGTFRVLRSALKKYAAQHGLTVETFDDVDGNRVARDRLFASAETTEGGCLLFTGSLNEKGYGYLQVTNPDGGRRKMAAHRAAYELTVGPIPDGLQLDHLCHNRDAACDGTNCLHRRCINPDHLEAVPPLANIRRSRHTVASKQARKTHCVNGHEYTKVNTARTAKGNRTCRRCIRERQKAYRERRKARS